MAFTNGELDADSTLSFSITRAGDGGYALHKDDKFSAARSSLAEVVIWLGAELARKYQETPYVQHVAPIAAPQRQPAPQHHQPALGPAVSEAVESFPNIVRQQGEGEGLVDRLTREMRAARGAGQAIFWAVIVPASIAAAALPHA